MGELVAAAGQVVARPIGVEVAVAVQVMAFSRDPIMRWMYPGAEAYLRHFPAFAGAFGGRG